MSKLPYRSIAGMVHTDFSSTSLFIAETKIPSLSGSITVTELRNLSTSAAACEQNPFLLYFG